MPAHSATRIRAGSIFAARAPAIADLFYRQAAGLICRENAGIGFGRVMTLGFYLAGLAVLTSLRSLLRPVTPGSGDVSAFSSDSGEDVWPEREIAC